MQNATLSFHKQYSCDKITFVVNNFPVQNRKDFEVITIALEAILNKKTIPLVPENLEGRIKYIQHLLDPNLNVNQETEYENDLTRKSLIQVIQNIRQMSLSEQDNYVNEVRNIPDHILVENSLVNQEFVSLLLRKLNLTFEDVNKLNSDQKYFWLLHADKINSFLEKFSFQELSLLDHGHFRAILIFQEQFFRLFESGIHLNKFNTIGLEQALIVLKESHAIKSYLEMGLAFDAIVNLNSNVLLKISSEIEFTKKLVEKGLTSYHLDTCRSEKIFAMYTMPEATLRLLEQSNFDDLSKMECYELIQKLSNGQFNYLIENNSISLEEWNSLEQNQLLTIIRNSQAFLSLQKEGISLNDLIPVNEKKFEILFENYGAVIALLHASINLKSLLALEEDRLLTILTSRDLVIDCMESGYLSQEILSFPSKDLIFLNFHSEIVKSLVRKGVSLEQLIAFHKFNFDDFASILDIFDKFLSKKIMTPENLFLLDESSIVKLYGLSNSSSSINLIFRNVEVLGMDCQEAIEDAFKHFII